MRDKRRFDERNMQRNQFSFRIQTKTIATYCSAILVIILATFISHTITFGQQIADSVKWRFYFTATDSANPSGHAFAKIGYHPLARYGMPYDTVYGFADRWRENAAQGDTERDWPPTPPSEDIRFNNIRSALNSNQYSMIHPFTDSTLVDTVRMIWLGGDGQPITTPGHVLRWSSPSVLQYYADSIFVRYQNIQGLWLNINLLKDSLRTLDPLKDTIGDGSTVPSNNLRVIVYHPKRPPRAPDSVVTTYPPNGALNISSGDTLKWQSIGTLPGMTPYYRVQLANDRTFKTSSIVLQDSIPGTIRNFTVPQIGWYYWRVKPFTPFGLGIYKASADSFYVPLINSVVIGNLTMPALFTLHQNYPNPFNPVTSIVFDLPKRSHVRLQIFNMLGQPIETLINGVKEAGQHTVTWDGSKMASGLYYYRITTGARFETKKMLLLR